MKTALLGYTGFVGSNLAEKHAFDDVYNTSNIADLRDQEYDLIVSTANRADSHRINEHPDDDRAEVDALIDTIESARAKRLVLISTVCVYPGGSTPNEETTLDPRGLTPYGVNRLHQERRLSEKFDTLIVRLPQLYGNNLKKGVVYDLLNDYRVEHIRPDVQFQHYDVRNLWADISAALDAGLSSLNVASPPLTNRDLAAEVFGVELGEGPTGEESAFSRMYTRDMRTIHTDLYGGSGGFLTSREQEVAGLRAFVSAQDSSEDDISKGQS